MDTALFLTLFLFAIQTSAGVAPMMWPQHAWLAGLIFWASGIFAFACLIWWCVTNGGWLMAAIAPHHLIATGIIIAAAGLVWQYNRVLPPSVPPAITITVPSPAAVPKPQIPIPLIPIVAPLPAGTQVEKLGRYVQLKELIAEAKNARDVFSKSCEEQRGWRKHNPNSPNFVPSPMSLHTQTLAGWHQSREAFRKINMQAYANRDMDLDTVPELQNPLHEAPDESVFGGNGESRFAYRKFHFLCENNLKQADQLIADMTNELNGLSEAVAKMNLGK